MTKLRRLKIKNFKSLKDVEISFSHMTVLVGMNGAGKTTIIQAIDFISQLMIGRIDDWLAQRDWEASDLNCKLTKERNIEIELTIELNDGSELNWEGDFNLQKLNCTSEQVFYHDGSSILRVKNNQLTLRNMIEKPSIMLEYQGSIISSLNVKGGNDKHFKRLIELKEFLRSMKSLEMLAPTLMRKRSRNTANDIGTGGEKLSAFLGSLKGETHDKIISLLRNFYPNTVNFKVSNLRSGWKKLEILEEFGSQQIETEARHINDGLLRILAILAQTETVTSMLLLDEIENGINPEIVEKLVDTLVNAQQQIMVTTHSPMILNYMTDDIARQAVQFVYKSPQGLTGVRRFFDIPRIGEKLTVMGPGEAFVDTDLILLTEECVTQDLIKHEEDIKLQRKIAKIATAKKDES